MRLARPDPGRIGTNPSSAPVRTDTNARVVRQPIASTLAAGRPRTVEPQGYDRNPKAFRTGSGVISRPTLGSNDFGGELLMLVHGLRLYPQTVQIVRGVDAPIYLHGRLAEAASDFWTIFHPIVPMLQGRIAVASFGVAYDENFEMEDPWPALREQFGASLLDATLDGQLMLLDGDGFVDWGLHHADVCGCLPIFDQRPDHDLARRVYWDHQAPLSSANWPAELRAIIHNWDDIYWQIFSTDPSDIATLIRAHAHDARLKLFRVELDREYPDPSNRPLDAASLDDFVSDAPSF